MMMLSTTPTSPEWPVSSTALLSTSPSSPEWPVSTSMMLSTSPSVPEGRNVPIASGILCTGHVTANCGTSKLGAYRDQRRLKNVGLQLEEDSTDIGSAMSSDVDVPYSSCFSSPCCTDNEDMDRMDKSAGRSWLRQQHRRANNRTGNFAGTPLEPIVGTPAGMTEHPPLFNTLEAFDANAHSADCSDADESEVTSRHNSGFRRPPGLESPQRSRRPRNTSLLATAPKLPSPGRNRKSKGVAPHSVLATSPENLVSGHVLPASPTRRARLAVINQAKREEAPLKVQMEAAIDLTTFMFVKSLLDPLEPVKKKPILADVRQISNIDEPVKKRVTPWLLAAPEFVMRAMPR